MAKLEVRRTLSVPIPRQGAAARGTAPLHGAPAPESLLRRLASHPAVVSLGALLVAAILVQGIWSTVIRPRAASILAEPVAPAGQIKEGEPVRHNLRSVYVILKDYEQEIAVILGLWALALIGQQAFAVAGNRRALALDFIDVPDGHVVLPDDARTYARPLESLPGRA
jgi:hypothetical protein